MQLFANNALSTLAGAITNVATSMSVQPGHGARFPSPTAGDYFLLTLFELVGGIEANHEIVKVTARSVDTLTIVRAQESTAARAFGAGAQASHRATAGTLSHLAQTDMPTTFTQPVTILTAAPGTNTAQAASTAFVTAAVSVAVAALVASSPAALDTLNELAAALGNDANYATTISTALGNRLRVDAAQGLSAPQKAQAVANLGLATVATSGLKADVGLGNVDNTSDVNKPVSTAQAAADALKANIASPTFTGAVATTDAPFSMNVTTGGAARNFALTQATAGSLDLKISAAAGGSATAGSSLLSISTAGVIMTGSLTGTVADGAYNAKLKGATGMLRIIGYSTSPTGVDLQSVNAAENAFLPFRVIASTVTLAYAGGSNAVVVSSAGADVTGNLVVTGNVGLGTASYTHGSALQLGRVFSFSHDINSGYVGAGWYGTTSGVATYAITGNFATRMHFDSALGGMYWLNAVAGTAGATVTFTERMRLTNTGNFLVGTTTDNAVDKVQIGGSLKTTGAITAGSGLDVSGRINITNDDVFSLRIRRTTGSGSCYIGTTSGAGNQSMVFSTDDTAERMRLTSTGNFLIATTTDDTASKLQVNGGVRAQSLNAFGSAASFISAGGMLMYYTGSGVGVLRAYTDGSGTSGSLTFANAAGEMGRFDSSGNFLVAAAAYGSGSASNSAAGFRIGDTIQVQGASQTSYNGGSGTASCLRIGMMTTGRSVSAVGTINASGADYAEYMVKAAGVGDIAKGDVIGINEDGEVTDRWLDAVTFMVKTTNPSYVGGDSWSAGLEGDELEAARAKVDRIAFAGQVPVNVYGAKPGQIILPARFGDKVGGIAVDASTLSMVQYMRAVGIVQNILPDGRANIRVKVA